MKLSCRFRRVFLTAAFALKACRIPISGQQRDIKSFESHKNFKRELDFEKIEKMPVFFQQKLN